MCAATIEGLGEPIFSASGKCHGRTRSSEPLRELGPDSRRCTGDEDAQSLGVKAHGTGWHAMTDVQFATANGDRLPGYLATPPTAGPWPAVVVIMDALGLSPDIRSHADRLADAGYLALAPDLYARGGRRKCVTATVKASRSGVGPAFADIEGARRYLIDHENCTGRVGIIGFCMGGGFALLCSLDGGYNASSVNYGFVPEDIGDRLAGGDPCPIVGSF